MIRLWLVLLTVLSFSALAAPSQPLTADNFGERFEAQPMARRLKAYAYKGDCREGYGKKCTYSVRTTTIDAQSREDGKGLRSVTVNCSACEGAHMLFILPIVLKMLLPKEPPKRLGSCLDASMRAIDNSSTEIVEFGQAQFIASRHGKELTATVAFKD